MSIVISPTLAVSYDVVSIGMSILAVGVLIFVHELGHFLACRATRTRVETFSIGFGPRLFGWETEDGVRRFTVGARKASPFDGAMDVRISIVPLGGYVKMAGENPGDRKVGASDEFPSKPFSARLLIITAGVIMNALAAVAFSAIGYAAGAKEAPAIVGSVGEGSPAWRAGLEPGDRVLAVDGDPVRSFQELHGDIVYLRKGQEVVLDVERAGKPMSVRVKAEYDEEAGAPRISVAPVASWTAGEGKGAFTVGAQERVTVGGRYCYGGSAAASAAEAVARRGDKSVRVVFLDRPSRDAAVHETRLLDLTNAFVPAEKPAYKLGVAVRTPRVVEWVRPSSAAEAAGFKAADEIVSVDGTPLDPRSGLSFLPAIGTVEVKRGAGRASLAVGAKDPEAVAAFLGGLELSAADSLVVDVEGHGLEGDKSPAEEAGMRSGDVILRIGDKRVSTWKELLAEGKNLTQEPVMVVVRRGTEEPSLRVTPRPALDRNPKLFQGETLRVEVPVSGFFGALGLGVTRTLHEMGNVFRTVRSLVAGDVSADKNLGGPGTLVMISAQSYADGWGTFLIFLAIISVNLCILNILPIPVLDGGHLLFLVIEKVKGSPVRESTIAKAQIVGLVALLVLMGFAVKNDFKFGSR